MGFWIFQMMTVMLTMTEHDGSCNATTFWKHVEKRRLMLCYTRIEYFGFPLYIDLFKNNSKQSRFIQYCTQPSKFHVCFSSNLKPRTLICPHWRLCWKSESLVIPLSSWSRQKILLLLFCQKNSSDLKLKPHLTVKNQKAFVPSDFSWNDTCGWVNSGSCEVNSPQRLSRNTPSIMWRLTLPASEVVEHFVCLLTEMWSNNDRLTWWQLCVFSLFNDLFRLRITFFTRALALWIHRVSVRFWVLSDWGSTGTGWKW